MTDLNYTHCGDHFAIYTNTESFCCTPETNIMSHVDHTLLFCRQRISIFNKYKKLLQINQKLTKHMNSYVTKEEIEVGKNIGKTSST